MKKSQFIILLIVWGLMICGCSTNNDGAKKEQIKEDIETSEYLSQYNLEVYDINIEKRKTDRGNKIDSIFVSVNSKNEDIDYLCKLELNYTLYNEGWLVDSILPYQEEEWCINPFIGLSQRDIEDAIKMIYPVNTPSYKYIDEYNTTINRDGKLGNELTHIFELTRIFPYATYVMTQEIKFNFFIGDTDWSFNKTSHDLINVIQDWNINGTWEYIGSDNFSAKINVDNYDGKKVECTYDINCQDHNIQDAGSYKVQDSIRLGATTYGTGFSVLCVCENHFIYFTFNLDEGVIISGTGDGNKPMTKIN